jgi:GR25 family glycosyltransferase involved in LPS biosynthesis
LSDELIESGKKFGITIEKVDGIYSNHDEIILEKKLQFFKKMKEHRKTSLGIKGCFLSHYLLWEKCIELNEPIMIFEHDALLIRPLPNNILDLFTHHCILDYAVHYPNYEEIIAKDGDLVVKEFLKLNDSKLKFKSINKAHAKGSHAHIVKPLGAVTLVESVKKFGILPADMCVNQYYTSYVTIDPLIARCHPFFSNESNRKQFGHIK